MQLDSDLGLSEEEVNKICSFIERIKADRKSKKRIFPRSSTGLPCHIERIFPAKRFLIRGLPSSFAKVGKGAHKEVKKCILYGNYPKIIVSASGKRSVKKEISILRKLKGSVGIPSFVGASHSKYPLYSMYIEYYSCGTLGKKIADGYHFTEQQVLKIAHNIACGLYALRKHHVIHRDLHEYNIVLEPCGENLFKAAIVDFGKAIDARSSKMCNAPSVAQHIYSPELLKRPYSKNNLYLQDIYAAGSSFYQMVWGTRLPWNRFYNQKVLVESSKIKKAELFTTVTQEYKAIKEKAIGPLLVKQQLGSKMSPYERFKILIFEMVDFDPNHRPDASQLVRRLEKLLIEAGVQP